nr:MAG TPA: hypothetical protein [Caudoviricetes sp.]
MKRSISPSSAECSRIRFSLTLVRSSLITATSHHLRCGLHLKHLHGFRQYQLGIHTLGSQETNLTGISITLVEALEGHALAVTDPVEAEITEEDRLAASGDFGHEGRSEHRLAEQSLVVALMKRLLPQELTIRALQLTDGSHSGVIEHPNGVLAVRSLQAVEQGDDFFRSDSGSGCSGHTDIGTTVISQDAQGLGCAVTVEEGILFLVADTTGELSGEVTFQVKSGIVQKFLGDLDDGTDLVGTDGLLTKGIVTFGNSTLLVNPGSGTLGGDHRNLVAAGVGLEHICVFTDDTLLAQGLYQSFLELIGNQVAAFGVDTDLQRVANLIGNAIAGTGSIPEGFLVGIGSNAGLGICLCCGVGLGGDGSAGGSVHFTVDGLLALHAVDLGTVVLDLLLHLIISGGVLRREQAVLVALGGYKSFGSLPSLVTLCAQFVDSHNKLPPVFDKVEPFHKVIGSVCTGGFGCFGCNVALCCQLLLEGIDNGCWGIHHGYRRNFHILCVCATLEDSICKAKFHSFVGIHPGFGIHEVGQFCTGQPCLKFIGIDDGILNACQHINGFLHFRRVTKSNGHRVVNHHHGNRRHQYGGARHSNDRCCGCGDAVNLD